MIKQGSISFDFDGTGNIALEITAALEREYEKIFRSSRQSVLRNNKNISKSIILIVFGCFLLEAICNKLLKTILKNEIKLKPANKLFWDKLKRSNTLAKLEIIKEYGNKKQLKQYADFKKSISNIIELRNKLAHYKDDEEPLKFDTKLINDSERFLDYVNSIPNPKLIAELMDEKIELKSKTLFVVFKWLKSVEKYYFKETLKVSLLNDDKVRSLLS